MIFVFNWYILVFFFLKAESEEAQRLKYLEFVQVAVLHAVLVAAKLYDYAKDNSGPLKPGVQTVEGTVKTIVGPVYSKFHDVPIELLKFVDRKVWFFPYNLLSLLLNYLEIVKWFKNHQMSFNL